MKSVSVNSYQRRFGLSKHFAFVMNAEGKLCHNLINVLGSDKGQQLRALYIKQNIYSSWNME